MRHKGGLPYHLRRHKVIHKLGDFIGLGIQRKVSGIEHVYLGVGHIVALSFGLTQIERKIMLSPDHEQLRLSLTHPGLPFWIGFHIRTIVIRQIALNLRLSG